MDPQSLKGRHPAPADTLLRAPAGDAVALGQLLDGFRDYLLAVANHELDGNLRARLGPSHLVQETFLRSQRAFAGFSGSSDEELRAWPAQILVNRCRDLRDAHWLTAKRGAYREVPLAHDGSAIGPVDGLAVDTLTPSGRAVVDEEVAQLMSALAGLPDECRQIVWLRNWEGLRYEEIGRRTGRTAEAARKVHSPGAATLKRRQQTGHWNTTTSAGFCIHPTVRHRDAQQEKKVRVRPLKDARGPIRGASTDSRF